MDVIRHARDCCVVGTLIVLEWPSAFFRPLLKSLPSRFASFVVFLAIKSDLIILGPGQKVFYRSKLSVFCGCPKFTMLALCIDFRLGTLAFCVILCSSI